MRVLWDESVEAHRLDLACESDGVPEKQGFGCHLAASASLGVRGVGASDSASVSLANEDVLGACVYML